MTHAIKHIMLAALAAGACAPAVHGATSGRGEILFTPNPANPQEEAGYPRVIRLQHSGEANGTLLATFAHVGAPGEKGSQPIYRSTDNGKSWSSQPIGVVRDTINGWDIEAPALFELPVAQGDLPAGTLFASGTAWNRRDFRQQAMQVYISRDHGMSWSYRSSCASEALQVNNEGHGIWEPYFVITADGSLNCFFSDERPSAEGLAQVIAHVRSTDGGATWGPEIWDIGVRNGLDRPGMPTVLRLPDGRFVMSYENCKAGQDANHVCFVYLKSSPDGQDWTPIADLGSPIMTADGKRFLHTPAIAWTPYGGANGTLIAAGQRVVTGVEGHAKIEPETGQAMMINTKLGKGPWTLVPAPFRIDPTGGYGEGQPPACANYSSPILASTNAGDPMVLMLAGVATANGKCEIRFGSTRLPGK